MSYSAIDPEASDDAYSAQDIRSDSQYRLADPSLLDGFDEFRDGITLQIVSVFPGFVLQQIQNADRRAADPATRGRTAPN